MNTSKIRKGQWWTKIAEHHYASGYSYGKMEVIRIIGGLSVSGRHRVFKMRYKIDDGQARFTGGIYSTMKVKTILSNFRHNDLQFLIRYGGPREFIKKTLDSVAAQNEADLKEHKRVMQECKDNIHAVKVSMKYVK